MSTQMDRDQATRRVEERMGFYIHATAYVLVNAVLIAINLTKNSDDLWFFWPLMGWGIGLAAHAIRVFGSPGTSRLKERMIDRELRRNEARQTGTPHQSP